MPRPRSTDARDRVVAVVRTLAVAEGLSAVTIDEVARRSGVAKTTIYRHFSTREELLIAALAESLPPPEAADTGSLHGDLVEFLSELRPLFAEPNARSLALEIVAVAHREPALQELQRQFFGGRMGPLLRVLGRARDRGEIGEVTIIEAIEIVHGPFMVRSLSAPETIVHLDLHILADRAVVRLRELAPPVGRTAHIV